MGQPKLALPLGDRTVIEHVVCALRAGGIERVLVVIGPHVPELVPLATRAGGEVLLLDGPTPDMRATVERGITRIESTSTPAPEDLWALAPGDCPMFSADLVRQLLRAATADPALDAVVPVLDGRCGHPLVLRWRAVAGIRMLPPDRGINTYVRDTSVRTWVLPVEDQGALIDLDTPADYARLAAPISPDPRAVED
jgi:molybdenum cofactor cytidylyltransferase